MIESSTMPAWCARASRGLATYFPARSQTPYQVFYFSAASLSGSRWLIRSAAAIRRTARDYQSAGRPLSSPGLANKYRLSCISMRYQTWGDYTLVTP
jgi:hypothetical protein